MDQKFIELFGKNCAPEEIEWFSEYLYEISLVNAEVTSGIYFLFRDDELQYIGKSINVLQRLGNHMKDKDFNRVFFLPVVADSNLLEYIEMRFIDFYKPPLNKTCRSSWMYDPKAIMDALEKANIAIEMSTEEINDIEKKRRQIENNVAKMFGECFERTLKNKSLNMFGEMQWIGSRKLKEINERFVELVQKGDIKTLERTYYDLAMSVVLLEYRMKRTEEIKSIDELERIKSKLIDEIADLENLKKIKRYWADHEGPNLVA